MTDTLTTHPDDCRMCEAGEPMAHNYEPPVDTLTVEIPALVRDNSEAAIDYAFRRDMAQTTWPYHSVDTRKAEIRRVSMFPSLRLTHYTWQDVNPDGQRCRFDMIVDRHGIVVNLFHTEYFTRSYCATGGFCYSYATHYALVIKNGEPTTDGPLPYCDEHLHRIERQADLTVIKSERLLVGQHD
jgi:hypothetical protein